jgi:methyltransferase (TIGR00027 family)
MAEDAPMMRSISGLQDDKANVGVTAFWIAGFRALEFRKGDNAAVKDPYAEALMDSKGWGYFDEYVQKFGKMYGKGAKTCFCCCLPLCLPLSCLCCSCTKVALAFKRLFFNAPSGKDFVGVAICRRVIYFDDKCLKAAAEGVRQCVIIGAGLDTRAYRLFTDYPDMHVIEIDHPDVFKYKEPKLQKAGAVLSCRRTAVGLEYDDVAEWPTFAQQRAGFDPRKPTIFVMEGLTMYLTDAIETDLYKKINSVSAIGSWVTGDTMALGQEKYELGMHDLVFYSTDKEKMKTEFVKGGYRDIEWTSVYDDSLNYPGGPLMPRFPGRMDSYFVHHAKKTA